MNTHRISARLAGTFFLTAMAASLIGGGILESGLGDPLNAGRIRWGAALELVNAFSVIGIAAAFFPVLRRELPILAPAYFGIRIVETMICILGAAAPLALLASPAEHAAFAALREAAMGTLLPWTFGLGATLLYLAIYRTRLIPRWFALWGWIATALMLLMNSLPLVLPPPVLAVMVLPIILNEIVMGIRLVVRGYDGVEQGT